MVFAAWTLSDFDWFEVATVPLVVAFLVVLLAAADFFALVALSPDVVCFAEETVVLAAPPFVLLPLVLLADVPQPAKARMATAVIPNMLICCLRFIHPSPL